MRLSIKSTALLVFTVLLYGCALSDKPKIGFIVPHINTDRWVQDRDFFVAKVNQLGGEVITMDGKDDDNLQIQQANELIDQGVKVLAVACVNKNTAAAIVRNAHAKGVKVIAYERIISNCDLDYFVSFDNVKVGEMMASYALKLKPEGNYFLLEGDKSDQNAIWVKQGHMNILEPQIKAGKIKIVYDTYVEDWSGENAHYEFDKYLSLNSNNLPDVLISAYDGLTSGAIKATEEHGIGKYAISTGQNAELEACRNIIAHKQSMTVYKPLKKEAETAAELAIKCAKGEKTDLSTRINNNYTDVPAMLILPFMVDETTMKSTVISDGFLKESDIYGK